MVITFIETTGKRMAGPRLIISFQLKNDEVDRFQKLETAGQARNKLYKRDALLRELVGLDEFDLITEEEWLYFRGKAEIPQTLEAALRVAGKILPRPTDVQNASALMVKETSVEAPRLVDQVAGARKVRNLVRRVPCFWDGKSSEGGICEDCRKELMISPTLTEEKLNDLPYGALLLNDEGRIVNFNKDEAEMSRTLHKRMLGQNFFTEVVVCTDVQEFYGKYEAFLESNEAVSKAFEFTYTFSAKRHVHVLISFIRIDEQHALVVSKKVAEERIRSKR